MEYIISLDISSTNTGIVIMCNDKIINHGQIKNNQHENMANLLTSVLDVYKKTADQQCADVVIVLETFTDTIHKNNRVGNSYQRVAIVEVVKSFARNNKIQVFEFLPWSWRYHFDLPTKVVSPNNNFKLKDMAKNLGHDILKRESLLYVTEHREELGLDTMDMIATDDEAEALLIINAWLRNGRQSDHRNFRKLYTITKSDIIEALNDLFK